MSIRHLLQSVGVTCCICITASVLANDGSVASKSWQFRPPLDHPPPRADSGAHNVEWSRNGIDPFIQAKLDANDLSPSNEASSRSLIRRLYFDLIGLPPSPEEVHAFVSSTEPTAYEKLVDRLLADPRHGERWARYWLDLARYADTAGYEGDPDYPHAWRYRDYVIDSLNTDKPYDLFIKEQIAGDEFEEIMGAGELPIPDAERVVAMTFLRLAPFTEPRGDETRHDMLSEMTATVGSVFLGLTVGCAKCHDHKYDEIPTKDFYRMKAFMETIQIAPPERGDFYQIGGSQPAEFYRPGDQAWADRLRNQAERELESSQESLDASKQKDEGELTEAEKLERRELERQILLIQNRLKRLKPAAMSLRHSIGPPFEAGVPTSYVMVRGQYDHLGEVVEAGFLSAITGHQRPAKIRLDPFKRWPTRSRRMALAKWIAREDNPLTARVMVNRLWQHHFGRGIVATPSDFGSLGTPPTHPELLDWMAIRFVESQWSLKKMHRLMVTSHTYRQASRSSDVPADEVDQENDLLWQFRRHRLEAEAIRDSILAVSGRLNSRQFGLPIFPPMPGDIAEDVKYSVNKWDTSVGAEACRRSVYIYQQRTLNLPFLDTFGANVCDTSSDVRNVSVTALQSLEMYNGNMVNTEAAHFARRVQQEGGSTPETQLCWAFQLALGREPTRDEADRLGQFLASVEPRQAGLVGLCRILLNCNEFIYVD